MRMVHVLPRKVSPARASMRVIARSCKYLRLLAAGLVALISGHPLAGKPGGEGTMLDLSFNPVPPPNDAIFSIALQTDGKLIVAGAFTSFNGTNRNGLARLNGDGSLDTTF